MKLSFERTEDMELVKAIVTHPHVYSKTCDDGCPEPSALMPIAHPSLYYILAKDGYELLGLSVLVPENAICYDYHICMLPNSWGPKTTVAAYGFLDWIWANTPAKRLMATIPDFNRLAVNLALRSGFEIVGINPGSFLKNGKLYSQVILGLSAPGAGDLSCQSE